MKLNYIILTVLAFVTIMTVCVMVKFATDISVEEKRREFAELGLGGVYRLTKDVAVIGMSENVDKYLKMAERFPYVGAITTNRSNVWTFACFACAITQGWVVTAAHCRTPRSAHRFLLFHDFALNYTHTYPVMYWRQHESYSHIRTFPKYDIAIAKLNQELFPLNLVRPAIVDERESQNIEASLWKTVSTMDRKLYLTNIFVKLDVKIGDNMKCFDSFGYQIDDSLICVNLSLHEDCFVHEFGPVFSEDKLVGILAVKPNDCTRKEAIFTNVSYYTSWILNTAVDYT